VFIFLSINLRLALLSDSYTVLNSVSLHRQWKRLPLFLATEVSVLSQADTLLQQDVTGRMEGKIDQEVKAFLQACPWPSHNFQTEKILTAGFKKKKKLTAVFKSHLNATKFIRYHKKHYLLHS